MKKTIACCLLILFSPSIYAQLGIGTKLPDSSAVLDISSTAQGFLPPRMTTAERDSINDGEFAEGLIIYNIDEKCLQYWTGISWQCSSSSNSNKGSSGTDPIILKEKFPDPYAPQISGYTTNQAFGNLGSEISFITAFWISNDRFVVIGKRSLCPLSINPKKAPDGFCIDSLPYNTSKQNPKAYSGHLSFSIFNVNFGKEREFSIQTKGLLPGEQAFPQKMITLLENDKVVISNIHEGKDCNLIHLSPTICRSFAIIDLKNEKKTYESDPMRLNLNGIDGLVGRNTYNKISDRLYSTHAMKNNGFVVYTESGIFAGSGTERVVGFYFDKDGKLVSKKSLVDIPTAEGIMPTIKHIAGVTSFGSFGFSYKKGHYNSDPAYANYTTRDFSGNVIKTITVDPKSELSKFIFDNLVNAHSHGRLNTVYPDPSSPDVFYFVHKDLNSFRKIKIFQDKFEILGNSLELRGIEKISNYNNGAFWYSSEISVPWSGLKDGGLFYIGSIKEVNQERFNALDFFSDGSPYLSHNNYYNIYYKKIGEDSRRLISLFISPGLSSSSKSSDDQNNYTDHTPLYYSSNSIDISPDGYNVLTNIRLPSSNLISILNISNFDEISAYPYILKSNNLWQRLGKQFTITSKESTLEKVIVKIGDGYKSGDELKSYCRYELVSCTSLGNILILAASDASGGSSIQGFTQVLNEMRFRTDSGSGKRVIEIQATSPNGVESKAFKFTLNVSE